MSGSSIPPIYSGGSVSGPQGAPQIPPQAQDDVNQISTLFSQIAQLFQQYMTTTNPASKEAIANKIIAILTKIDDLNNQLSSMKPPLPADVLGKSERLAHLLQTMIHNAEMPTSNNYLKLGVEIGALQQQVNPS